MSDKPRILVVDDDPVTLRRFEFVLKTMGAIPCCLPSSREAAELINREKFDGVVLTWESHELNGAELTQRIRHSKSNSKVPIVMLTARRNPRAIAEGFRLGVTFFLSKPVGVKELGQLLTASRGAMLEERRRYQRLPLCTHVVCEWSGKRFIGETINVSTSGILLTINPCPAVGTAVSVEFTLPKTLQTLVLKGAVVRTGEGEQVAIKFTQIEPQQRELLKTYGDRSA
ncbi:MAG: response regulator [Terriglobia bacterium]